MQNKDESISNFTLILETRQQALKAYMSVYGPSYTELAKKLDIAVRTAIDLYQRETVPPLRVEQMKELGIPEELLPEPLYVKPGPKPIRESDEAEVHGYDA